MLPKIQPKQLVKCLPPMSTFNKGRSKGRSKNFSQKNKAANPLASRDLAAYLEATLRSPPFTQRVHIEYKWILKSLI